MVVKTDGEGTRDSSIVAKRRDEKIVKALAKHLNQGAGGQRAARTKRKKGNKK